MALVRLQCPACSAIVKVGDDVVARHPIVRCAKCQGLVTVATSRVVEPETAPVSEEDDVDVKPKPFKKRRRKQSEFPVKLLVGGFLGLIALLGLGFVVYLLIDSFTDSGPEKVIKKTVALLERMVNTLEGINTPEDATKAVSTLTQLQKEGEELKVLAQQMRDEKIDADTNKRLQEKYKPKMEDLMQRLLAVAFKLQQNPQVAQALRNQAGALGMAGFAGLGGFQLPNMGQGPPMNMQNTAPFQFGNNPAGEATARDNTHRQQSNTVSMWENTLLSRNTLSSSIPDILGNVRDFDSAEHALLSIDAMIISLRMQDQNIKKYERQMGQEQSRQTTEVGSTALKEFKRIVNEIRVHMDRIEKMPDLRLVHSKLISKLSEVDLYDRSITRADARERVDRGETSNPFQPADSGKASKMETGKNANPFEPAGNTNSSKNGTTSAGNPELDTTLSKLTSTDHFRKREGLREINLAKVDEARKKEVLEALLTMMDDSDVNQKGDVLKAFKKWATSQADKNQIAAHVESLLKDHWAKKDTLRYLGENKVVGASKEVARLLKEPFDRKEAAETLIAMGSEAEMDVKPYLSDLDSQVRHMAIEVLARIGTRASVPDLQRLLSDRAVGLAAKQAIQLINSRKK